MTTPASSADPRPVLLLAAIDIELIPVRRRLRLMPERDVWRGRLGTLNIVAAVTGIGVQRAVAVLQRLVAQYDPSHIIDLGFAGGLDPTHHVGDVIDAAVVMNMRRDHIVLRDDKAGPTLLTADSIVGTIERKRELFHDYAAAAVDMESFYIAQAARERQHPVTLLRAVSDDAATVLPAESASWVTPDGRADKAAAMRYLACRPWHLGRMLQLQKNAQHAGEKLAAAVEAKLWSLQRGTPP